jgi:seryl-tRNA synthetase
MSAAKICWQRIKDINDEVKNSELRQQVLKDEIDILVNRIGNIVDDTVPVSKDEEKDNEVVVIWGARRMDSELLNHHHLLFRIGGYEPERGVKVAGHRAYFLRDAGVLLNQALIMYGTTFLRQREYSILQPPFFMNKSVMGGVAQLSQFDEELYHVAGGDEGDKYLIATSEQPICAFHQGEWLQEKQLPIRYGGISTCFRKEAGSHGRDTWGIFRVHQFEKVEQFVLCEGDIEISRNMHEEMLKTAEQFYQSLGLAYRVVNIVSGELNNAAIKKYDLEGWFPGYDSYRELVSCSNCTDYQSRAMEIRCGNKKMGEKEKKYVHLLNATLCATTRTICCILENYQTPDGVRIPEALIPYMGGITFLPFIRELPSDGSADGTSSVGGAAAKRTKKKQTSPTPAPSSAPAPTPASAPSPAPAPPPAAAPAPACVAPTASSTSPPEAAAVVDLITSKGEEIRLLKAAKVSKEQLQVHIDELLALKMRYKEITGEDYIAPGTQGSSKKKKSAKEESKENKETHKSAPKPAPSASSKAPEKPGAPTPTPVPAPAARHVPSAPAPSAPTSSDRPISTLEDVNAHLGTFSFVSGYQPSQVRTQSCSDVFIFLISFSTLQPSRRIYGFFQN